MNYNIEIFDITYSNNKTIISLKGWAHYNNYKILIENNKKKIDSFSPNKTRFDISKFFNEEIKKNNYGFEIKKEYLGILKNPIIYLIIDEKKILLATKQTNIIQKIIAKMKYILGSIKKIIIISWRKYKFIIPFKVIVKNIKRLLNKKNLILYNPNNQEEYNNWILNYETKQKKIKYDLTFLVLKTNNPVSNFYNLKSSYYIIDENISNNLKEIKTKYVAIIKDNCGISNSFGYYIKKTSDNDFIYFDNDYLDNNNNRINPCFKPDYSDITILGYNYIGDFIVIEKSLTKKINFKTNNIYSYILDIKDFIKRPRHISKILYHQIEEDINQDENFKIVTNYLRKNEITADIIKNTDLKTLTVKYKHDNPLISIIIPTRDYIDILDVCLKSIYTKTTYSNYEIIIVDNNSNQDSVKYFNTLKTKYKNLKVLRLECEFNYSYLNNQAVSISRGEYVVLLNNDTEVISGDWLDYMVGYASLPKVGAVGVKLLYPDNTLQHIGILLGKGGVAGHICSGRKDDNTNLILNTPHNVSAVTAACLMIKKTKYMEVHGLEEKLKVAFNDVDFNLKLLEKGYQNIVLPNIKLYHYESKSRGEETTIEKQKRFMKECAYIENRWDNYLKRDKFYNSNYSIENEYMLSCKEKN